jgi:hypothetical protein
MRNGEQITKSRTNKSQAKKARRARNRGKGNIRNESKDSKGTSLRSRKNYCLLWLLIRPEEPENGGKHDSRFRIMGQPISPAKCSN